MHINPIGGGKGVHLHHRLGVTVIARPAGDGEDGQGRMNQ